jgi:hypothetical protein
MARTRPTTHGDPLVTTTVRITPTQWHFVQSRKNKGLEFSAILRAAINQLMAKEASEREPTPEEAAEIIKSIRQDIQNVASGEPTR